MTPAQEYKLSKIAILAECIIDIAKTLDKENLILIKNNLEKFKNNKHFMKLVEDLIINYPEIEKSDYQELMKNKQKEILMLNNICLSTMQSSYIGISDKI